MEVVLSSILEVHHSITNVTLCILSPSLRSPAFFSSHIPTREPVHWLNNSLCQIGSLNLARRFSLLSTLHLNRQKMLYSSWLILLRLALFTSLQSSHTYVESRQRGGGGGGARGAPNKILYEEAPQGPTAYPFIYHI